MNPLPESSSPPVDARVACAETNNACAAGASKSDDPGRGGFPDDIEELVAKYILHHAGRDRGGRITVFVTHDFKDKNPRLRYFCEAVETTELIDGNSIKECGDKLAKIAKENTPEQRRAKKVAKLEAELASLKGEGGGL